jgi:26S proteasome regulatory subunit N4
MILAHNSDTSRRQSSLQHQHQHQHQNQHQQQQHQLNQSHQLNQQSPYTQHFSSPSTPQQNYSQPWVPNSLPLTPQSQTFPTNNISNTNNINFNFGGVDQILFDFQPQQFGSNNQISSQPLMQSEQQTNTSWLSNGQLTPTSTRPNHHRESSLSSIGSPAAPASPFAPSTSNPQVAGETYHEFHEFPQISSKPLTPAHTPLSDHFLAPYSQNYYPIHNPNTFAYNMGQTSNSQEMLATSTTDFAGQGSSRPSITTVASNDSPSTPPPSYEDERRRTSGMTSNVDSWLNEYLLLSELSALRNTMPKLDRTMTDVYNDELYNPAFSITSAPPPTPATTVPTSASLSPRNDVFSQRLQAANSQHLSNQIAANLSPRERSPFRQGSPLAPSPNVRFGTATHMRELQKAENDEAALRQQFAKQSPEETTPVTISPKDVDKVYHETEEAANMPLFPQPQQKRKQTPSMYQPQPSIKHEASELEETASQQSFASMATTRRESSSAYSTSSQNTPQQAQFNFAPPAVPGSVQQIPQHYPFVPQSRRQTSNMSNVTEDFPTTLTSMESSASEYSPETRSPQLEIKRPSHTTADSGTYTCTYHGCTLRFETPVKLQRHKREAHRGSGSVVGSSSSMIGSGSALGSNGSQNGSGETGMTSAAQKLNSQSGPHKCERINPSTGKPCNTIFSRPYDLTRHEDTIHNTRKQKLRCNLCAEEKTFSRNDALTRHMRVVHPEVPIPTGKGRKRVFGSSSD